MASVLASSSATTTARATATASPLGSALVIGIDMECMTVTTVSPHSYRHCHGQLMLGGYGTHGTQPRRLQIRGHEGALYASSYRRIVSHRIASYRIVSHRIASYRIVSHRIASYRIVSHRIASYRIVLHRIASCGVVSYRYVLHRIASCGVVPCFIVPLRTCRFARVVLFRRDRYRPTSDRDEDLAILVVCSAREIAYWTGYLHAGRWRSYETIGSVGVATCTAR
jgi:hypothetical protein